MTVSIPDRVLDERDTQPATVCTLLRDLGVPHACAEKQKLALGTWLSIHEPIRPLRISLLENGYGLVLKASDYKRAHSGCPA